MLENVFQSISAESFTSADGRTTATDLVRNFQKLGLNAAVLYPQADTELRPGDICLVSYAGFNRNSVQDKAFTGLHWLVWLGQEVDNVIVHDPNFWGSRRSEGANKAYTRAEWDKAFVPYKGRLTIVRMLA